MLRELVGASCASIVDCLHRPRALVLNAAPDRQQPAATTEAIARHFRLVLNPLDIAQIGDDTIASGEAPDIPSPVGATRIDQLGERDKVAVDGALGPYLKHWGNPAAHITWVREPFLANGHRPRGAFVH